MFPCFICCSLLLQLLTVLGIDANLIRHHHDILLWPRWRSTVELPKARAPSGSRLYSFSFFKAYSSKNVFRFDGRVPTCEYFSYSYQSCDCAAVIQSALVTSLKFQGQLRGVWRELLDLKPSLTDSWQQILSERSPQCVYNLSQDGLLLQL